MRISPSFIPPVTAVTAETYGQSTFTAKEFLRLLTIGAKFTSEHITVEGTLYLSSQPEKVIEAFLNLDTQITVQGSLILRSSKPFNQLLKKSWTCQYH